MYREAIALIKQSIFPIFFKQIEGNDTILGVSGTGFFIDDAGHFVTANHVINNVPPDAELFYVGNVPHHIIQPISISESLIHKERDLFIGQVASNALAPVKLDFSHTQIGTSVCLCGYPMAQIRQNPDGSINVNNVRQYWQPSYSIDAAQFNQHGIVYEGFITQDTSLQGMSGGPVFDTNGHVVGIDVATYTRKIPLNNGKTMRIKNGVVASLHSLQMIIKHLAHH